jgi:N-methylhydantoinase B
VEINEIEVPIRITRYGMVPDSAGAGRHRGGLGTSMEFQVFAPNTVVTARNRDRSRFASWGVLGGKAGSVSRFTRNPGTAFAEDLGVHDLVQCQPGDVIRLDGCGGGGYGSPFERVPEHVLHDVRCGYVSPANARLRYGVAIVGDELDLPATQQLRAQASVREPARAQHFDHGEGREAFEAVWTPDRYAVLNRRLAEVSPIWRHFVKLKVFDAMDRALARNDAAEGGAVVERLLKEVLDTYPQLRTAVGGRHGA